MDQIFYPAIFHTDEKGGFWVSFPDFPECLTQGDSIEDAYKMAADALGLCIDERLRNKEELPKVSSPMDYVIDKDGFTCLIEFDYVKYHRTHSARSVKKTLSIPEWLNEIAIAQNINFSQVLQDALMQKIGISEGSMR